MAWNIGDEFSMIAETSAETKPSERSLYSILKKLANLSSVPNLGDERAQPPLFRKCL